MTKSHTQLPPELSQLLDSTPTITDQDLAALSKENRRLFDDPDFLAEIERARFVDSLLSIMKERGITPSQLARKIGKSRQYVHKILNEDERISFSLKTMVRLCHALGRRLDIQVRVKAELSTTITVRRKSAAHGLSSMSNFRSDRSQFADKPLTPPANHEEVAARNFQDTALSADEFRLSA